MEFKRKNEDESTRDPLTIIMIESYNVSFVTHTHHVTSLDRMLEQEFPIFGKIINIGIWFGREKVHSEI